MSAEAQTELQVAARALARLVRSENPADWPLVESAEVCQYAAEPPLTREEIDVIARLERDGLL